MADFGFSSSPSSSSGGGMDSAKRSELMDQVKSQLLVAQLQELLSVSYRGRAVYMYTTRAQISFKCVPIRDNNIHST